MKNKRSLTYLLAVLLLFSCCFLVSTKEKYYKIRMMSFNLGQFYDGITRCPEEKITEQQTAYQKLLDKYAPDFIFTQENPQYMDIEQSILGDTLFQDRYKNQIGYTTYLGKQIFSNYEMFDYQQYNFSTERDYIKVYARIEEYTVALYNVHLGLTKEIRAVQIAELLADIQTEEFAIVAGDFNAEAEELAVLNAKGYILANNGKYATCGEECIDNIIFSSNIKLLKATVECDLFEERNDHRPFIATLGLNIGK